MAKRNAKRRKRFAILKKIFFGDYIKPLTHTHAHTYTHVLSLSLSLALTPSFPSSLLLSLLSLSLPLRAPRGEVTRQGVVLTDLQSLVDCQ